MFCGFIRQNDENTTKRAQFHSRQTLFELSFVARRMTAQGGGPLARVSVVMLKQVAGHEYLYLLVLPMGEDAGKEAARCEQRRRFMPHTCKSHPE